MWLWLAGARHAVGFYLVGFFQDTSYAESNYWEFNFNGESRSRGRRIDALFSLMRPIRYVYSAVLLCCDRRTYLSVALFILSNSIPHQSSTKHLAIDLVHFLFGLFFRLLNVP